MEGPKGVNRRAVQSDFIDFGVVDDFVKVIDYLFVLCLDDQPLGRCSPEHVVTFQAVNEIVPAASIHGDRLVFLLSFIGYAIDTTVLTVPQGIDIRISGAIVKTLWCRVMLDDKVIPIRHPKCTVRSYFRMYR